MDNYPEQLAPIGNGTSEKEPFQVWWGRVSEHFPTFLRMLLANGFGDIGNNQISVGFLLGDRDLN
jgi:hypothetical protein